MNRLRKFRTAKKSLTLFPTRQGAQVIMDRKPVESDITIPVIARADL